jgi:hypothetical protein
MFHEGFVERELAACGKHQFHDGSFQVSNDDYTSSSEIIKLRLGERGRVEERTVKIGAHDRLNDEALVTGVRRDKAGEVAMVNTP